MNKDRRKAKKEKARAKRLRNAKHQRALARGASRQEELRQRPLEVARAIARDFEERELSEADRQLLRSSVVVEILDLAMYGQSDDQALEICDLALEVDPESPWALEVRMSYANAPAAEEVEVWRRIVELQGRAVAWRVGARDDLRDAGLQEVSSYFRARIQLARALAHADRDEEAIESLQETLELRPSDDIECRSLLVPLLLGVKRIEDARRVLDEDAASGAAWTEFSRALLLFLEGDRDGAREAVLRGEAANPFVLRLIAYQLPMLATEPDAALCEPGSEMEAYLAANRQVRCWDRIPGARDWLRAESERIDGYTED